LKNDVNKKRPIDSNFSPSRIELYLGTPPVVIAILFFVLWLPEVVIEEFREYFYLPYANEAPILLHPRSGIFTMAILPSAALLLPILIGGFLKLAFKVDFSPYQRTIDRYFKLLGGVAIVGLALSFLINAYIAEQIEAKGYAHCHKLDQFSVARRVTGYVRHPMLCVDEDAQADALRIYKELHISHPNLFP